MNEKIVVIIENPTVETFPRKNGRIGQKIVFLDDKYYRHEIDAVDKEDNDLSDAVGKKIVSFVASPRNQKATMKFGDKGERTTYFLVLTVSAIAEIQDK